MATNVGTIVGAAEFYADLSLVSPEETRDSEPPRILVAVRDGRDVGLRRVQAQAQVAELATRRRGQRLVAVAAARPPRLALLRRVTDLDLSGTVTVNGIAASDPLLSWVQGPRGLGDVRPYDSLWLRLVDLPAALAARGYEADCDVVRRGRRRAGPVERRPVAHPGQGRRRRGRRDRRRSAQVALPVAALGAAYLGSREPRGDASRGRDRRARARAPYASCGGPSGPTSAPTRPRASDPGRGVRPTEALA